MSWNGIRLRRGVSKMLRIVKKSPVWQMDANGHVLDGRFFREIRRAGANLAELSSEQWRGMFGGTKIPDKPKIDGMNVKVNAELDEDEVRFYDNGALVGVMKRL